MKKPFNYFLLLTFTVGLFSCAIWPNSKLGFDVFEKQIDNKCNKYLIFTNGVYGSNNDKYGVLYYFYNNGTVKVIGWTSEFFQNPDSILNEYNSDWQSSSKEDWGEYSIDCDTLTIQVFNRNNMEFYKRQVVEDKCILTSDSSFVLVSSINKLKKFQFVEKHAVYYFYPTQTKPDSTKAWFNNKRWFKKNLHESRKVD